MIKTESLNILQSEPLIDLRKLQSEVDTHSGRRMKVVYEHGKYFDSYLATEPGRKEFWCRDRLGLISYQRSGRHLLVGGGIIAPSEHKAALLEQFLDFAREHQYRIAFFNIGDDELPLFRTHGFEVTKWGEEPILNLADINWNDNGYAWVRRQSNYCHRAGVLAFEVPHAELTSEHCKQTLDEMIAVGAESLESKTQRHEMRFFEGRIGDHELGMRRVFIARSESGLGRIEGFVVCTPIAGGTIWATELYRRRKDAVRGTMAFLFHTLIKTMQSEGIEQLNLCLNPGLHCTAKLPGDSTLIRLAMSLGAAYLGVVFDSAGLRHFKSRFRPSYECRYVCSYPRANVGLVLAFARVSGLFNLSLRKLWRVSWQRLKKRAARRSLPKQTSAT